MKQKVQLIWFWSLYHCLNRLTLRLRSPLLIRLKLFIGLSLIACREAKAQTVVFPNTENVSDTLQLDVYMQTDNVIMCYEIVVIDHKRFSSNRSRGDNSFPTPPFSSKKIQKFFDDRFNYPTQAINNKIQGSVLVKVDTDKNGKIINSEIVTGLGYGIDEEIQRIISYLPKFGPARSNYQRVKGFTFLKINVKLPEE
jgi:TonB family protein